MSDDKSIRDSNIADDMAIEDLDLETDAPIVGATKEEVEGANSADIAEDTLDIAFEDGHSHHSHGSDSGSGSSHHHTSKKTKKSKKKDIYVDANGRVHQKGVRSSKDRHHGNKNVRPMWQKIILSVLLIIVILIAVLFIGWQVLTALGKRALYNRTSQAAEQVALAQVQTEEQLEAIEEAGESWQPGWVRYNGETYEYNEDILTFFFMGIDKDGRASGATDGISGGQADALFLVIINPDTKEISLLAVNRNTMTNIDVYNKEGQFVEEGLGQICLQHGYGDGLTLSCDLQVKAVSNLLYNIPIQRYFALNRGGIYSLMDTLGGITVPKMTFENGEITYGEDQTLNGKEAYSYLVKRDTKVYDSASFRLEKQKEFIKAFTNKVKSEIKSNPAIVTDLYNSIIPYSVTDIELPELTYLVGEFGDYSINMHMYTLEGETISAEDAVSGFEEFVYDEEALYDLAINLFYQKVETGTENE